MKKNIGFVPMDSSLAAWLLEKLTKEPPVSDCAVELRSGIQDMLRGEINSLLLSAAGETELPPLTPPEGMRIGELEINPKSRRVISAGKEVSLTPKEFDILYFLAQNRGEVFTKEQIYRAVWSEDYLLDDSNIMAFIRKLRKKIEQKGCVISEYPPESGPVGPNGFLQRNRLIAALSSALVVVEAQEKSGTMSTVNHAERYGKPVFVVPGSIYSPNSAGTNGLLRDGRARAVAGAADLLAALGLHTRQAAPAAAKQPAPLSDTERRVLAGIGPKPVGIEELCVSTGLPMSALLGTLMKLELTGRVYKQPGQRYVLR